MKTLCCGFAVLVILGVSPTTAQQRFFFGAMLGGSSTHLSGDVPDAGAYTSKTGFSVGLVGEYALTDDIRLSLQPSYARRGTGVAFDVNAEELRDSLDLALDYVSVPILARFLVPGSIWFVNGGLDLGFLLKASLENTPANRTTDVKHYVTSVDLAMLFGVGAAFDLRPVSLSLELRYTQSLLNAGASDDLATQVGMTPRFRCSGFQFLVGALLPL